MKNYSLLVLSFNVLFLFSLTAYAQNPQKAELYVESGHSESVKSVVFSPDGKLVISGSQDKTIRIWSVATGRELKKLPNLCCNINSIAVSPNGKLIAAGSGNKDITLWDIYSGKAIKTFRGHTDRVFSVAFSPDGKTIASASRDKTIKIWNVFSGKALKTLPIIWSSAYGLPESVPIAFSPDGAALASTSVFANENSSVIFWDVQTGKKTKTFEAEENDDWGIASLSFSADGKTLAAAGSNNIIRLWSIDSGKTINTLSRSPKLSTAEEDTPNPPAFNAVSFSPDGNYIASAGDEGFLGIWDAKSGKELKIFQGHTGNVNSVAFSSDGKILASGGDDNKLKLWDLTSGKEIETSYNQSASIIVPTTSLDGQYIAFGSGNQVVLWSLGADVRVKSLKGHRVKVHSVTFSPKNDLLASIDISSKIRLWDLKSGLEKPFDKGGCLNARFSPDGKSLACLSVKSVITIWDTASGKEVKTLKLKGLGADLYFNFTPDGKKIAIGYQKIRLWDIESQTLIREFSGHSSSISDIAFSPDGRIMATASAYDQTIKLWNVDSGDELKTFALSFEKTVQEVFRTVPDFYLQNKYSNNFSYNYKFKVHADNGHINIYPLDSDKILASIFVLGDDNWAVTTPDGRFDTNKSLDNIQGLHWIVNDEILKPLPLDVFLRQYYEPNLLQRVMANEKFKTLPSIASINRVQPKVALKKIKPVGDSQNLIDVTVEVESVEDEISLSAVNRTAKKRLASGAFDLRLFRDGQLIGVSTPKENLEKFIGDAAQRSAKAARLRKLVDNSEDIAWREANDIFKLTGENVKRISPTKIEYTFRNVKLPRNNRREIELTAYAFNSDRVKSTTTQPVKFELPNATQKQSKKGKAVLISIGVNASENPAYNLNYAANDARKMQEIVGARLQKESAKYSEVITIPLISDYETPKNKASNDAQKAIIKGVFELLEGRSNGEVETEIAKIDAKLIEVFRNIPNVEKLKQTEPEDTLIITYSGHGYADQNGIFYLLPFDIGKDTRRLTPDALRKMISSDELSLWMQNITAAEMIMIIDACHSSAAVQGAGFKPGPMGSRGLGQLAYDKDMKILSATQANNVALELNSLEQGLLSYALLQDGIVNSLADADKNKELFSDEWLSYAERKVPELYQEVKDGKRQIKINGKTIKGGKARSELANAGGIGSNKDNLQQPTLFDFKRREISNVLFRLP